MREFLSRDFIQIKVLANQTERAKPLEVLLDPIIY
jgi:hypothetical protein